MQMDPPPHQEKISFIMIGSPRPPSLSQEPTMLETEPDTPETVSHSGQKAGDC